MTNWAPPTRIAIGSICLIASFAMSVITWVALGDNWAPPKGKPHDRNS